MILAEAAIHAERTPAVEVASGLDLQRADGRKRRRSPRGEGGSAC
jgi:hypothetical protein